MPRDSGGTWTDIPGITAVPGQTIESADWNNYRSDLRNNEFNSARPITAGGTGATNPEDALTNLGGVGVSNFLDAYSVGDFYETIRTLDSNWLRRNGGLYTVADYPELAAILPALPDGVQWSNMSGGLPGNGFKAVLVTANYILVAVSTTLNEVDIWRSEDNGQTFGIVATVVGISSVNDIQFVNGVYTIMGTASSNGVLAFSNDSTTWSVPATVISGYTAKSMAYGAGLYVIAGYNGTIRTSPDLTTWTTRTTGVTTNFEDIVFANGLFVAVGGGGGIITSPDAITWTVRTSGVATTLNSVIYGMGVYLVVGNSGVILSSTNATAWTPRTSGTTNSLEDVTYSTSGFLAVGNSGTARISANYINWTTSLTGTSNNFLNVTYDPDQQQVYYANTGANLLKGVRTLPTQFQVPSDDPVYGWIRALPQDT